MRRPESVLFAIGIRLMGLGLLLIAIGALILLLTSSSGCDDWRCHEGDCLPTHRCVQQQSYEDCGYEYDFIEDRFKHECHTRWECVKWEKIHYKTYGQTAQKLGVLERRPTE